MSGRDEKATSKIVTLSAKILILMNGDFTDE